VTLEEVLAKQEREDRRGNNVAARVADLNETMGVKLAELNDLNGAYEAMLDEYNKGKWVSKPISLIVCLFSTHYLLFLF
jgi:hypothetical protein